MSKIKDLLLINTTEKEIKESDLEGLIKNNELD